MFGINRREFVSLLSGAAAWPIAARGQQSVMSVIGWLSTRSSDSETERTSLSAFRQALSEAGYVEGRNLRIEYRWAEGQYNRLPELAADLVRNQVRVIATFGPQAAPAAQAATGRSIPIVFNIGSDPVQEGLVKSLSRPGGNATGIHVFTTSLGPKRLDLLCELVPAARVIGFLVNPASGIAEIQVKEVGDAARHIGREVVILKAGTDREIDLTFSMLMQLGVDVLLMSADLFFQTRIDQLVALAARYRVPVMYEWPEFVTAGGLVSYSTSRSEAGRQIGSYVAQILRGVKPADLPVVQSSKFEFVINKKTANTLGLTVPPGVLAIADKIIE